MKINFGTEAYKLPGVPFAAQRMINCHLVPGPNERTSAVVKKDWGLKNYHNTNVNNHAIDGMLPRPFLNKLWFVCNGTLYSLDTTGTRTTIGGVQHGRVVLADNGTELIISGGGTTYRYTAAAGLEKINIGTTSVDFLDNYFLGSKQDSGQVNLSPAGGGSATWDELQYVTAEGAPDNVLRVLADHREAWLFGERTIEIWITSDSDVPLDRQPYGFMERGLASRWAAAKLDNTVFWLGDDRIIYRADSYTPKRISTSVIEDLLAELPSVTDAYAFAMIIGRPWFVLTFPSAGYTFLCDAATNEWHERATYGRAYWRANCYAYFDGKHLVGDSKHGIIYQLDAETYDDGGEELVMTVPSQELSGAGRYLFVPPLRLDIKAGKGLVSGQGSNPLAMLDWTDNGETWSNEHFKSLGKLGEYNLRPCWERLGMSKTGRRIFRFKCSDPIEALVTVGRLGE